MDTKSPVLDLDPRRWWTLGVLCLSLLIVFVGNSSLNVAIPRLSEDFHASTSQLQWVVASYSLVFAGLLFTAGSLGDRFGRKGALQFGLFGFLAASALATTSTQIWQLIACSRADGRLRRVHHAVDAVDPRQRLPRARTGPGDRDLGRRHRLGRRPRPDRQRIHAGPLLVRLGVPRERADRVARADSGYFLVPRSKDPKEGALDPVGALLSVVGLSSLVFGLIEAPDKGWSSASTILAFALAVVGLAAFVWWERRQDEPMLDMSYFRNPAFTTATGGMILVFMAMFGMMFLISQYFQLILGYRPLSAALRFLPIAPIMMIVSPQTPRIIAKIGNNRTVALGMSLVGFAFFLMSFIRVDSPYTYVLLCIAFQVTGMALTMSPMTAAIMSAVPPERAGAGSAMNDATRELGTALGVAVLGSIAASRYGAHLGSALHGLTAQQQATAKTSLGGALQLARQLPADAANRLISGADNAFVAGVHFAALTGTALAVVASLAVLRYLPRHVAQHEGRDAVGALQETVELGVAGIPPVIAEEHVH